MTSDTEAPEDTQNPADGSEPESGIDEKKMSLIEHLTELRRRLMYAAIAFVAVFLV